MIKKSANNTCTKVRNKIQRVIRNVRRNSIMSKIIVIGSNHAGTAAINTILDHYKEQEVVVYDKKECK